MGENIFSNIKNRRLITESCTQLSFKGFVLQEFRNGASGFCVSLASPLHLIYGTLSPKHFYMCVWLHLCRFSLSSCGLRRVGRNLLLARDASRSSISLLLSSLMAERMRCLSSRSTVPSSCTMKTNMNNV